jgi:hypothetical protein
MLQIVHERCCGLDDIRSDVALGSGPFSVQAMSGRASANQMTMDSGIKSEVG